MSASPPSTPVQPARDLINEIRKQNGVTGLGLWGLGVLYILWLANSDPVAASTTVLWLLLGLTALTPLLRRRESCPSCDQNLSFLPGEARHFGLPELSRKIRCCPYCGVDMTWQGKSDINVAGLAGEGSQSENPAGNPL